MVRLFRRSFILEERMVKEIRPEESLKIEAYTRIVW